MGVRNFNTAISLTGFCLCFLPLISTDSARESFLNYSCPGPIQYYVALGCTPVYEDSDSACPEKYNCDILKDLPTDKCVVQSNGYQYDIGESLREQDANPCDIGCTCTQSFGGPGFNCAIVDCFHGPAKSGCYRKNSPFECCPGEEVCPEDPEDRAKCDVGGKEYKEGEYFEVESDPDLNCVCQPGYKGENVEPFCAKPKHAYCSPLFRHADDVRKNCAPVYYSTQPPQTSCSVFSRCQNDKDVVIRSSSDSSEPADPDLMCTFGNLTMRLGDELNQATDYSSVCVKCVCEVPPVPTCQRLPDEDCDVTIHPPFDNY